MTNTAATCSKTDASTARTGGWLENSSSRGAGETVKDCGSDTLNACALVFHATPSAKSLPVFTGSPEMLDCNWMLLVRWLRGRSGLYAPDFDFIPYGCSAYEKGARWQLQD